MWFGGQFGGSFIYSLALTMQGREPVGYVAYGLGLLGAGIGLAILLMILRGLPQRELAADEHYQPRGRSAL